MRIEVLWQGTPCSLSRLPVLTKPTNDFPASGEFNLRRPCVYLNFALHRRPRWEKVWGKEWLDRSAFFLNNESLNEERTTRK